MTTPMCTVNGSSLLSHVQGAWVHAEWDNGNKTFDIGDLTNSSARIIWGSAFPHEPFIIGKCYEHEYRFNFTGSFVENLQQICFRLHLRCKLRHAEFGLSTNDSLNGVLGHISSGKAMMGLSAYSINTDRFKYFDLIPSPFSRYYQIIIHENNTFYDNNTPLLLSLIRLFHPSVWAIFVVIFITFLILLSLSGVLQGKILISAYKPPSFLQGVKKWALELLGSAIATYDIEIKLPTTIRSQIFLVGIWLCWTIIIYNFFASRLPSVLTTGRVRQVPFQSIEELVQLTDYTVYGTPYIQSLLKLHKRPEFRMLGSTIIPLPLVPPEQHNRNVIKLVESGKVAVVISSDAHHELAALSCSLIIAVSNVASSMISALVFPKNFPLRSAFLREYSARTAIGVPKADNEFYLQFTIGPSTRNCIPHMFMSKIESTFSHLTIADISLMIVMLLCGLGCAVILTVLEILVSRYWNTAVKSVKSCSDY